MSEPEEAPNVQQEAVLAAEAVPGLLELKRKQQEIEHSMSMSYDADNRTAAKIAQHEALSK